MSPVRQSDQQLKRSIAQQTKTMMDAVDNGTAEERIAAAERSNRAVEAYNARINDATIRKPQQFVTDTRAWAALASSAPCVHAINSGALNGVVFGTGEQNASLYDLSKQVDSVAAYRINRHITFRLNVTETLCTKTTRPQESRLPSMLGKDLAEKIVAQTGVEEFRDGAPFRIYRGLDLKVGGEGMRAFYG